MSVTCKIGQNDFDAILLQDSPETLSRFRWNLFFNKDLIKTIYVNYEICIKLICWKIHGNPKKKAQIHEAF